MSEKMREEFEAYWRDRECFNAEEALKHLSKEPCGGYTYRDPNEAWKVWQASRAAVKFVLPEKFTTSMYGTELFEDHDVIASLEAAGLRVKK